MKLIVDSRTLDTIRRFLSDIETRYDIEEAWLFGSRARGTHKPDSDADLAVILRGERQNVLGVKLDMADAAFDVMLQTDIRVSAWPIWRDEWDNVESYSNPALLRNIKKDGVRVSGL